MSLTHEFIIKQKCQLPRLKPHEAKRVYIYQRELNPLGPTSDQHQFSPNIISRSSRVKVMRITKLITKGRMLRC